MFIQLRVLVACEMSASVRDAFRSKGHDAWSVDLMETRGDPAYHIVGDALEAARDRGPWDLMIGFPPCTHLSSSGARWWPEKIADGRQDEALDFVWKLMNVPINKIAIENPVGRIGTAIRKPDQIIQPWQFGHGEVKSTCLWLKNLRPLKQ